MLDAARFLNEVMYVPPQTPLKGALCEATNTIKIEKCGYYIPIAQSFSLITKFYPSTLGVRVRVIVRVRLRPNVSPKLRKETYRKWGCINTPAFAP